jgi:branched-chain amino acid transport system ATP-binding protein
MTAALRVDGVSKSFEGLRALHQVTFTVEEGTIAGLIGPNGAGKTTLFNVIAGVYQPSAGRVLFRDQLITGLPPYRIAGLGIGRTFQLMKPFGSMTVLENVAVAAFHRHRERGQAMDMAREVIERVDLTRSAGQRAGELTTAARKRLELARALALGPTLLLLDEVLAGLAPAERAPVMQLLRDLREEGLTMLLVEHVMAAVMALSDVIHVLHHGELLASGSPKEVTSDPAVIDAYLGEEMLLADT